MTSTCECYFGILWLQVWVVGTTGVGALEPAKTSPLHSLVSFAPEPPGETYYLNFKLHFLMKLFFCTCRIILHPHLGCRYQRWSVRRTTSPTPPRRMKTQRVETGRGNWTSSCRVSVTLSDSATCGGSLISATGMVEVGTGLVSYNITFWCECTCVCWSHSYLNIATSPVRGKWKSWTFHKWMQMTLLNCLM